MGLPERFEEILAVEYGSWFRPSPAEEPCRMVIDYLKQALLDAVCAERGGCNYPIENVYSSPNYLRSVRITGPCQTCGAVAKLEGKDDYN